MSRLRCRLCGFSGVLSRLRCARRCFRRRRKVAQRARTWRIFVAVIRKNGRAVEPVGQPLRNLSQPVKSFFVAFRREGVAIDVILVLNNLRIDDDDDGVAVGRRRPEDDTPARVFAFACHGVVGNKLLHVVANGLAVCVEQPNDEVFVCKEFCRDGKRCRYAVADVRKPYLVRVDRHLSPPSSRQL